jgi:hypothetical protein
MTTETVQDPTEAIHENVRAHYARAALTAASGVACCGEDAPNGTELYDALERAELPDAAVLASLGCGNPIAVADLQEGERVLDLAPAAGSTSCCPPGASVPAAARSDST